MNASKALRLLVSCLCSLWAGAALAAELPVPPTFTKGPAATAAGNKVKIQSAVSREAELSSECRRARGRRKATPGTPLARPQERRPQRVDWCPPVPWSCCAAASSLSLGR